MADNPTATIMPERLALLQALAQQAAAYWRKRLEAPGYLNKFDNGDRSRDGEMGQIMASMAALRTRQPSADKFERFEQLLTEAVLKRLLQAPFPVYTMDAWVQQELAKQYSPEELAEQAARRAASPTRNLVLSVDYGPEDTLRDVAEAAGVAGFPWKTTMWVCWDARPEFCYVEVRAGYGKPTERLPAVGQKPLTLATPAA